MIYIYRIAGFFSECFPTPEAAVSFARNMGLEGRVVMRAYRVTA